MIEHISLMCQLFKMTEMTKNIVDLLKLLLLFNHLVIWIKLKANSKQVALNP